MTGRRVLVLTLLVLAGALFLFPVVSSGIGFVVYVGIFRALFPSTIYWGDGSTSSGTITGNTGGPFEVSGSHTYAAAGTYHPYVTFYDTVDNSTYTSTKGKATVN